ncbi:MAG: hypothetical protein AAFU85_00580 [Planctomycetota bacterium]
MKAFSLLFVLTAVLAVGCGGHSGGTLDVPLDQNPFQVSDAEQAAMDGANQIPEVFLEPEKEEGDGEETGPSEESSSKPKEPTYYQGEYQ